VVFRETLLRRPYEIVVALTLGLVGLEDITSDGYPPEIADATSNLLLHVYGVWIVVGSVCVLAGLFRPATAKAAALARFGHTVLATGLVALLIVVLPGATVNPRLWTSVGTCALLALCSMARAMYLAPSRRPRAPGGGNA